MFKFCVMLLFLSNSLMCCESVYVYSSFWAPLFNPSILNYRVDAKFDPESAKNARELYERKYGFRGEQLISNLGNGKGLKDIPQDYQGYGDVKIYYIDPTVPIQSNTIDIYNN